VRLLSGKEAERLNQWVEKERERQRMSPPMLDYQMSIVAGLIRIVERYPLFTLTKLVPYPKGKAARLAVFDAQYGALLERHRTSHLTQPRLPWTQNESGDRGQPIAAGKNRNDK
jgi:hypothetical protein